MSHTPMLSPGTPDPVSRRRFLQITQLGGLGTLLSSCSAGGLEAVLHQVWEPVNEKAQSTLFNPQRLAPEFPDSAIKPEALLVNDINTNSGVALPFIDSGQYKLQVSGEVAYPQSLSLIDLKAMPYKTVTMRHICVEGWAALVKWGGVPLQMIAALVKPAETVRYVYFRSADGYYESWDLPSALHPQTLMAYGMNDGPLPPANGAPLRLASPIKLGYKQSKWVTDITFLSHLPRLRGYWEDQGYEWYAGL